MRPLDQMLSPMITNRAHILTQALDKNDIYLIEKIKKQKVDVINQRLSPSEVDLVRPEIVESWIRSYNYGLDLYNYNYGPVLDQSVLKELLRKKELLLTAADPYIHQLETVLAESQCIILLSDEKGAMLRVIEGRREVLEKQNRRFQLVPGSVWNEETVGTCAHGLSMILGTPMQISGPEHYCETYDQIFCSSAPIFDVNNNMAGTLSFVSPSFRQQSAHSLGLVVCMAWAVQKEFQLALNNELLNVTMEAADEAVITFNLSGIIIKANITAKKILGHITKDLVGMHIDSVLGNQPLIKSVMESGKPVIDTVIEIENWNQKLQLRSAQPIKDQYGNKFGCVLTFKKIDRTRKTGSNLNESDARFTFDKIIGSSLQCINSVNIAKHVARLDANILLQGESGTGKEVYAQAIHNESRPGGPFIAINCAAIPTTLIESELFGYEAGAFTGAERQGRPGKIELANGGTLFLDEIGDMPLELQPVLLRVLQEKKVMRVGGSRYQPVDFRLIAATNKNLADLVNNDQFREDLYYRLEVFKIGIPPLRERGADIVQLAKYFIDSVAEKQQIPAPALSNQTILRLLQYGWPGNVRQLENAMLFAVNMASSGIIEPEDLPAAISGLENIKFIPENKPPENLLTIKELEKVTIMQTLIQTGNNVSETANLLGMSRSTLYRKIKDYGLLDDIRVN
jgi:transcriptional regulator of acetoin/glycerol metabolism